MHIEALDGFPIRRLAEQLSTAPHFIWLDSADSEHPSGRYSYLCCSPVSLARVEGAQLLIDERPVKGPVLPALSDWLGSYQVEPDPNGPPFQGGAVGYLSYDFACHTLPDFISRFSDHEVPLAEFAIYDTLIAFEHETERCWLISSGLNAETKKPDTHLAAKRIKSLKDRLSAPIPIQKPLEMEWRFEGSKADFKNDIVKTQDYIRAGDIYQANIAQCYTAADLNPDNAFSAYLHMREASPAPFGVFGAFQTRTIASTSPERLISLSARGEVSAQPIKGTIPRSDDPQEDARLQATLLQSDKDRAENIMIVDLLRNDLSRVCQPHSVKADRLCELETFSGLHHLTSTITGQLEDGYDAFDLLGAVFPGGSITGAPKLRAMEIIDGLEHKPRGAYCGSFGYIGFDGALDFNILIRTADITGTGAHFSAGAGITLLSDADAEFEEIQLKASRVTAQKSVKVSAE